MGTESNYVRIQCKYIGLLCSFCQNQLNVMPFKVGRFPVKYLGVPLITKRLGREECKQLIDKVSNKVVDWKNKALSYAGNDSWMWKCLLGLRDKAKQHIEYIVGNGKRIFAWYDKWIDMGPLCQIIDNRDLYNARFDKNATVADMISVFPELNNIQVPTLSEDQDKAIWRCNNGDLKQFSITQTWNDYKGSYPEVS
ncbi:hypothetical protein Tco_1367036 [Tanacetum coccineum]